MRAAADVNLPRSAGVVPKRTTARDLVKRRLCSLFIKAGRLIRSSLDLNQKSPSGVNATTPLPCRCRSHAWRSDAYAHPIAMIFGRAAATPPRHR